MHFEATGEHFWAKILELGRQCRCCLSCAYIDRNVASRVRKNVKLKIRAEIGAEPIKPADWSDLRGETHQEPGRRGRWSWEEIPCRAPTSPPGTTARQARGRVRSCQVRSDIVPSRGIARCALVASWSPAVARSSCIPDPPQWSSTSSNCIASVISEWVNLLDHRLLFASHFLQRWLCRRQMSIRLFVRHFESSGGSAQSRDFKIRHHNWQTTSTLQETAQDRINTVRLEKPDC